jgi:glutaminyl-peptide cyclotransferase
MLLDLLGTKNPKFYNYFPETTDLYQSLINAETALNTTGCFNNYINVYFKPKSANVEIDDDHMPFYEKGQHLLTKILL